MPKLKGQAPPCPPATPSRRQPFPVAQWLNGIYCHKERPPALQRDVLTALAVKFMDWGTGEGFASIAMISEFCGAARSTVQRALRWARKLDMLVMARRGCRAGDGTLLASEWRLKLAG